MKRTAIATLIMASAIVPYLLAQPSAEVPVVSHIRDEDPTVSHPCVEPPVAGCGLQILSDGAGDYLHKRNYLTSVIQSGGDWVLDLGVFTTKPSGRTAALKFDRPSRTTAFLPPPSGLYQLRFITRCRDRNIIMFSMQSGGWALCGLSMEFKDVAGQAYRIYFDTNRGSDDVRVDCLAEGAPGCTQWLIRPSNVGEDQPGTASSRGQIVKLATKKSPEQDLGDFHFAFSIDIAR